MSHKIRNIFLYHIFYHSSHLIPVEKIKTDESHHFRKLFPFQEMPVHGYVK